MNYRHARESDLPRIVEIYNATVASRQVTADLEPVAVDSRRGWFAAHEPTRRPLWVVESEAGKPLAGWLSFSDFYGRPAYGGTAEISIYLAGEARGHGLGRALLDEALLRAPEFGVTTLVGFIFGHNAPSLALFTRAGFATWGHLPGVAMLDGVARDLLILGKRLATKELETAACSSTRTAT